MQEDLASKKCVPCEGGVSPLDDSGINEMLQRVTGWNVETTTKDNKSSRSLTKSFRFGDFREAMAFLREVEEIAESEGHHPDFCVHYSVVDFRIWTHAIGGLHENDFILAAKIDGILSDTK